MRYLWLGFFPLPNTERMLIGCQRLTWFCFMQNYCIELT